VQKKTRSNGSQPLHYGQPCTEKSRGAPGPPFDFELPLAGKLAEDNRWAIGARLILRSEFEAEYAQNFAKGGAPAKSFRLALGTLIIKEKLGISDP
jgi:hypothetical protein